MGYTCFRITRAVRTLEDALLKETMLTKKAFHKKAFDDFLRGERIIDSDLKVTKRTADGYIKRSVVEQTFLSEEQEIEFKRIADENGVYYTAVMFQALWDYCVKEAELLPEELLKEII